MNDVNSAEERTIYQIRVQGILGKGWSEWFNEMVVEIECQAPPVTRLTGSVIDQARLRGIVSKLWDLNLTVISVVPIMGRAQVDTKMPNKLFKQSEDLQDRQDSSSKDEIHKGG